MKSPIYIIPCKLKFAGTHSTASWISLPLWRKVEVELSRQDARLAIKNAIIDAKIVP